MMKKIQYLVVILLFISGLHGVAMGQARDTIPAITGLKGVVWDSAHNHSVQDATVAIYRKADGSLVQFCVTDAFGEFQFKKLPLHTSLYMLVTYTGFELLSRGITLSDPKEEHNLGKLIIRSSDRVLNEVVITSVVPVRVNKDTIEFNARAFNLDSNAVVEDLMRQLPGMTVWGDGSITLNGREIKSLTVNGKAFFGKSFKVATQNIPKTAVNKIQVFNEVSQEDPLDTLTKMNIKLLEGHEMGYFGKIGVGRGTDERFLLDGVVSIFNARNQLSLGGAYNNTNKVAGNMTTLLENSSFKGLTANIDYQPDFRQEGINKSYVAGIGYKHNLSDKIDYNHNNAIKLDYFLKNQDIVTDRSTKALVYLNEANTLEQNSIRRRNLRTTSNDVSASYNFLNLLRELDIAPFLTTEVSESNSLAFDSSKNGNILQSTSYSLHQSNLTSTNYGLKILYRNINSFHSLSSKKLRDFKASYTFLKGIDEEEKKIITNFTSRTNNSTINLNRRYRNSVDKVSHQVGFEYNNLNRLIFGSGSNRIQSIRLIENFKISEQQPEDAVSDYDSAIHQYKRNDYLSNTSTWQSYNNDLSLVFDRYLYKRVLSGRFNKSVNVSFEMLGQSFYQKNTSQKSFQNIRQSFFKPLPRLIFTFLHSKYNYIDRTLSINYKTTATYPVMGQLAPLVDSSNIWFLDIGNPHLLPSIEKQVKITFAKSYAANKNYKYQVELFAGEIKDKMTDSIIYDAYGKAVHYIVNAAGYKYIGGSALFKKTRKLDAHQFQLSLNAAANYSHAPAYVNSDLIFSNVLTSNNSLAVLYTFRDDLAVSVNQNVSFYSTVQKDSENKFRNSVYNTSLAATKVFNKRVNISSDIAYNKSITTNTPSVSFFIWNAHATCRFTKKNNLELKFSAMDLLKQNKGIINYGTATTLTTGTTNVLRQYFMFTLSYFPRKFGK